MEIEGGLGLRVPSSVAEIMDAVLTSEALAAMVEDGLVKCMVHLATGIVTYSLASEVVTVL